MSADTQCIRPRAFSPSSPSPDQTDTESSMIFAAANPATASARRSRRPSRSCSRFAAPGSNGAARYPRSVSALTVDTGATASPRHFSVNRPVERFSRALSTPSMASIAPSIFWIQPAHFAPNTARLSSLSPPERSTNGAGSMTRDSSGRAAGSSPLGQPASASSGIALVIQAPASFRTGIPDRGHYRPPP